MTVLTVGGVYHVAFFAMQQNNMGVTAFTPETNEYVVLLHAFYLAVECLVLGFAANNHALKRKYPRCLHKFLNTVGV